MTPENAARRRRLHARLDPIFQGAPCGIVVVDEHGLILDLNAAAERIFGYPAAELYSRPVEQLVPEAARSAHAAARKAVQEAHRTMAGRFVAGRKKDGTELTVQVGLGTIRENGETFTAAFVLDVTEHAKMQAQLAISDRMVSIGTLAAGVAHEINNPLAVALSNLELASKDLAAHQEALGADAQDLMAEISDARDAARRVRDIVRDLKLFSRVSEDRVEAVDVARVLESSVRMAFNEIKHRARLVKEIEPGVTVKGESARLGQVFLNLLVNAAQAIPEGKADGNEIRVGLMRSAGQAVITVQDTGSGIPPEVKARLFTPFFTTKPLGVGTGLGLSICHRVVETLGGSIDVETEPGKGTLFRVILPAADEPSQPEVAPVDAAAATRRGRILVVDDEAAVGATLKRILGREHEVVCETRSRGALARLEAGERFDVILCDVMMPEMTGADLFQAIKARDPIVAASMIFVTGGAFTPTAQAFLRDVPNLRVEKPFDPQSVRALVNSRIR